MSTNLGAYCGRILKIDLNDKKTEEYPFSDIDRGKYLGGKIMAAKIFYDHIKAPIDPLSAENMMVISTCPLTGTGTPSSSRFNITSISPLTGLLCSSNCGGNFGLHLKRAGYDAIILVGKSSDKIMINIVDDKIDFVGADNLWGKTTGETQAAIGGKSGKIVIGPAGENLVKYACIISEERAAGRGGLGAVLGSKNVKAITAAGTRLPLPHNKEKLTAVNKKWVAALKAHPLTGVQLPKLGTAGLVSIMNAKNLLATKNFKYGKYDKYESVSGEHLAEKYLVKTKGCISCPIQCARYVEIDGKLVKGPELETLGLLGPNILNDNLELIIKWNYELDEMGMDTISFAGTLAFAMELNEKGMWDNGLSFGKTDNINDIIHKVAYRADALGNELAEGTRELSKKYGGAEFCMSSKGMELSAYEPRAAVGQGLGYAVSNRGGCHLNAGYLVVVEGLGLSVNQYTHSGKASLTMTFQNLMEAVSAGGNCLFTTYAFFPKFLISKPNSVMTRIVNKAIPHLGGALYLAGKVPHALAVNIQSMLPHPVALSAATGLKLNFGRMLRIGERGYNLERLVNVRLGASAEIDSLPDRLTKDLQDANNKKSRVPLTKLKRRYYKSRGWTAQGIPKEKLVKRLKID